MGASEERCIQVAIASPVFHPFDYRWSGKSAPSPGARVRVPFGARQRIGVVLGEIEASEVSQERLRPVSEVIDDTPVLTPDLVELLSWASRYYHHPIGEVMMTALPVGLRGGREASPKLAECFLLTEASVDETVALARAPLQQALLDCVRVAGSSGASAEQLRAISPRWRVAIRALERDGRIERQHSPLSVQSEVRAEQPVEAPVLSDEQRQAVDRVASVLGRFEAFLLHGVTGSGKTEVYLQLIEQVRARGGQTLVLVPEIALTPQLLARFAQRSDGVLVGLHSGLSDGERLQNWLLAAEGRADIVVGTRSAVFAPLPRLGLVIVDEEHDTSFKQQDGFRYHARDLVLVRARAVACPVVLGTATPSFESLNNVERQRYTRIRLKYRAGEARPPRLALMDIRRRPCVEGLGDRLIEAIGRQLDVGGQSLIFLNRRGYAPTLLCQACGEAAECRRCDANMTVHRASTRLRCHHCGAERPLPSACEHCGHEELDGIGLGTERIASTLSTLFPNVEIARIDRDSTRRKGELARQLDRATSGQARVLVGTQMLAKGHHFPELSLVGVVDADRALFGTDYRALETMGQLITQVAGRAGREQRTGEVLIQTRNPDNPLLRTLVTEGYDEFSRLAMQERRLAGWPPYSYVALVRAEAIKPHTARDFLQAVVDLLHQDTVPGVDLLGPAPAPMERLGGRYRAQLLLQAGKRSSLNRCLAILTRQISALTGSRRTRWSIDVDPIDLF